MAEKIKESVRIRTIMQDKLNAAKKIQDEWAGKTEPMPEKVQDEVNGLYGEFDTYKAQLDLALKAEAGESFMNDPDEPRSSPVAWREAGPGEGDTPVDAKAWREIEIKTARVDPVYGVVIVDTVKTRFHVPLAVQGKDQGKAYTAAFEAYLRKGFDNLGPSD